MTGQTTALVLRLSVPIALGTSQTCSSGEHQPKQSEMMSVSGCLTASSVKTSLIRVETLQTLSLRNHEGSEVSILFSRLCVPGQFETALYGAYTNISLFSRSFVCKACERYLKWQMCYLT